MKTILRILIILLAAALVSGTLFLLVNNTSSSSAGFGGFNGQPTALVNGSERTSQLQFRGEGGGDGQGTSFGQGLMEIIGTLLQLTGITIIVLLTEKAIDLFRNRRMITMQNE